MGELARVISSIEREAFANCMNPPEEYVPTQSEIDCILKIKEIIDRGSNAEVRRSKDGGFTVYEVKKVKR